MKTIGERLKFRRDQLGLSTPALAKQVGGIKHQTIQAIEKGGGTRHLLAIAKALGVTPEWLQDGHGPVPTKPDSVNHQKRTTPNRTDQGVSEGYETATIQQRGAEPLKVMGMAEGGPDGWNLWNGEPIETKRRPDNLIGVRDAYGVRIHGRSMEPVLRQGWLLHVHPWKHPEAGDFVVVQRRPLHEGDPPLAVVKMFVKQTPGRSGKLVLEQYNPAKTFDVPNSDLVSVHVIVGTSWT